MRIKRADSNLYIWTSCILLPHVSSRIAIITFPAFVGSCVNLTPRECNLSYFTLDSKMRPSQTLRSLVLQETIKRGVLMPSLVVSYAHDDSDIDHTIEAIRETLQVYRRALEDGVEKYLVGRPTKVVYRRHN